VISLLLFSACVRSGESGPEAQSGADAGERAAAPLISHARALARMGDYVRAEQYVETARQRGAGDDETVPLLLEVCIRDQRYRSALEHGTSYLKRRPSADAVRLLIATLYAVLGEAEAARRELQILLDRKPDTPQAHYRLALLLRDDLGDPRSADLHFREYLRLAPSGAHAEEVERALLTRLR
jgi:tetratricopeptide (TPR) repeat protein